MNTKDSVTLTKITKLTAMNVSALEGWAEELKVEVGKTTATFVGTPQEAAARVRQVQEKVAAVQGRKAGAYASLHAVARKLENFKTEDDAPVAPAEDTPAEAPETPKLELVVDSTDKNANPGGVFGKSVGQAVEEEKAKRGAQQAADAILKNAGYEQTAKPNAAGDIPVWGTAKTHGLKDGQMFMFYGQDAKGPKAEGTVRKYSIGKGGVSSIGGHATRFWFAPIIDKVEQEKAAAKKAPATSPAKDKAPAKKSAGSRAIPQEAANAARAKWITENGLDTYKKQYNGGWDSATYGQGEKKAKSGDASPAWMDGYTDRTANPGKEGIAAKWAALKSTKAPVAKI